MPIENEPTLKYLEGREAAALAELKKLAPEALKEYLEVRSAIAGLAAHAESERRSLEEARSKDEYATFTKPFTAIKHYLEKVRRFEPPRDIAQAIADGGFARDEDTRPFWNVIDAIGYHVDDSGRLVKRGDLIGLKEWLEDDTIEKPKD